MPVVYMWPWGLSTETHHHQSTVYVQYLEIAAALKMRCGINSLIQSSILHHQHYY